MVRADGRFPIAFEEIRGWNMGMTGVSFVSIIVSEVAIRG